MAEELKCEVPGCGRKFVPGKEGAAKGRCGMHYARLRRGSDNADEPGPVYEGNRNEKMTAHVPLSLVRRAEKLASQRGISISRWMEDAMERLAAKEETRKGDRNG